MELASERVDDAMEDRGKIKRGAVILAGGDSKRLGRPKGLLDFNGQTLIGLVAGKLLEFFQEITVVTDRPDLYEFLPARITGDLLTENQKSSLRGIHAGLSASNLPYQFVAACDLPFLNLELIKYMSGFAPDFDAVVPRIGSYYQPLHAFYKRSCIDIIERQVRSGHYKVTDFYDHIKIKFITLPEVQRFDPEQQAFININTWNDYEQALEIIAGERESS